ncbi:MAG TPA: SpoIVB peptidase S55 domain-containing protein [Candidatus Rifleibacterium sp.]|mgnify:FL=1|nr:SpoIVB peptidase S55 domain-containing protein [Candidatus Rifleibacterium sp.]
MGMSMLFAEQRFCIVVLLTLAFLFGDASLAFAQNVDILRLKDVKVGMKGFGKTVVLGRKIETFDVEVLGILANNKVNENVLINGKSILVKVSGEVIKRAGGIAAGMSGSPVYIDGKLMGGVSSGWIMTDHTVGLVTPIEEMLEIWSYPDLACADTDGNSAIKRWIPEAPLQLGGNPVSAILEAPFDIAAAIKPAAGEAVFRQASVDVYIEGLYGRAADVLKTKLQKKNVIVARKGALPAKEDLDGIERQDGTAETFEPGSALGIQLARGDINMTTLGTVTHRSGPRILALAHPFLKKGAVSFLLTGAYIHHSFSSVQMPFKIGAPTEMLGVINQDREKGLSGEIGRLPEMVPVQIDVFDKNLQINRSINYQIVRDPSVFVMVLESTLIQALEGVIDRAGAGTALMGVSLDCSSRKGEKYNFRRENMFYSRTDIVQALINEVTSLMDMVTESEHEEVMPTRLLLKIEVETRRRTLSIEKVEIKNSSVSSGGILDVEVTLRPFREKKFVRKVKLPIPHDIGRENLTLSVYGLNMKVEDVDVPADSRESKTGRDSRSEESLPGDFDAVIRSWVNSPKNSDILFQLTAEGDETKKLKLNGKDFEIQPTNLVVTGRVDTTLTLSEE